MKLPENTSRLFTETILSRALFTFQSWQTIFVLPACFKKCARRLRRKKISERDQRLVDKAFQKYERELDVLNIVRVMNEFKQLKKLLFDRS